MKSHALLIAALAATLGAACASDLDEQTTDALAMLEPYTEESALAGGPETAASAAENVLGHDADHPCGKDTLAVVETGPESAVYFCGNGVLEGIGEVAPLGTGSAISAHGFKDVSAMCAADIFRALAPDRAVPQRLLESCAAAPPAVRQAQAQAIRAEGRGPSGPPDATIEALNYCSASGPANFINERCAAVTDCSVGADCSTWCIADLWGWHERALSWQLGEEGNSGEEHVASCNGNTRFRAWWRDDIGDSWISLTDDTILSGSWGWWYWYSTSEVDFRFRADSNPGAGHRHTGIFMDW